MSQPKLSAEKINSPIQLMAAWFVMLILLSTVLLAAASQIEKPDWAAGYLVISTSILVLIVLASVIAMLTKFRPNLQEGKEYAEWLKDQNSYSPGVVLTDTETKYFSKLQAKLDELKQKSVDKTQSDLIEEIEDEILYKICLTDSEGSNKVIKAMEALGLKTSVYHNSTDSSIESSQSIWLGSKIPANLAIKILKEAIKIWPHLKYISLSSDTHNVPEEAHWQIYLGGATSTAINEGLKPWTHEELNKLNFTNTSEFHVAIRAKYT